MLSVCLLFLIFRSVSANDFDAPDDFDMDGMGGMGDYGMGDYGGMGDGGGMGGEGDGRESPPGALQLDSFTFDKVVGLKDHSVLVKFDSVQGEDEESEFHDLCKLAHQAPRFFVGEVQVDTTSSIDERQNDDLRARYQLEIEEFPVYVLFNGVEHVKYNGADTVADISDWLRSRGVGISRAGTIAEMDDLVVAFVKEGVASTDKYVQAAEALIADKYPIPMAKWYPKIMSKVQANGLEYITKEQSRVQKVLSGTLAMEKRTELSEKLRVLVTFAESQ